MNIFSKVTLQSLKKNKTRTIVTIIGIMLSTALICAVTTSFASAVNYARKEIINEAGNWHGSADHVDHNKFLEIRSNEKIDAAVYIQHLGFAKNDGENNRRPFLYIEGIGEEAQKMLSVKVVKGRLPETNTELALPEIGSDLFNIGDTVTLDIGTRRIGDVVLDQGNPYYVYSHGELTENDEESFDIRERRTYTVVGVYDAQSVDGFYGGAGFPVLTAADSEPAAGDYGISVYFRMKKPKQVYDFMEKNYLSGPTNHELLITYGVSRFDGIMSFIASILAIIIGLIMFGSIALIYNAFAISVSERAKQFGLLSSIGATKKQLRRSVFFEAFAVSVVGIPLGILLGIAGIGVTFKCIGDKFSSMFNTGMGMSLCVTPLAIVSACVIAFVTILLSAYIPSKRAARMSAVEAIRQSNDIKASKKHIKTPKIIYKLFGLPGMLAHKYFKRSKKRYRATIFSLFMSIVLFISAAAFTENLVRSVNVGFDNYGYDIQIWMSENEMTKIDKDELLRLIKNDKNTKDAAYSFDNTIQASISEKYLTKEAISVLGEYQEQDGIRSVHVITQFINDEEFIKLLDDNGLSREKYMDPENPLAVAFDSTRTFDREDGKFVKYNFLSTDGECEYGFTFYKEIEGYYFQYCDGDTAVYYNMADYEDHLEVPAEDVAIHVTARSGKILRDFPFYVIGQHPILLVYPFSVKDRVVPKGTLDPRYGYDEFAYFVTSKNHKESYTSINEILKDNDIAANYHDYAEEVENTRNIVLIVKVFAYGFIVLISLIAAANVFNTISTNVALRRREFAMLRSVGMTSKGIWKMLNFECVIYGIKALLYGLPVSGGVCWLMQKSFDEGFEIGFLIPWKAVIIAVFSVFLVVFATMLYAMNRIRNDNPIDALKNENI